MKIESIKVVALVPFEYGSKRMMPPPGKDVAARANAYELELVPVVAAALCRSGQAAPSFQKDSDDLATTTGERHAPFFEYAHLHPKRPKNLPPEARPKAPAEPEIADKPISDYTKAELAAFLDGQGIEHSPRASRSALLKLAEAYAESDDD